ncbi:MAG: 1-acyl-sn-glycerol-3-phosphate acyltransferase [Oscillospiraceae bacterium]|nr:1-acyl-sn-glycerol-3-phosphate acyltransferase [Oscillospiraceae bacterium]
MNRFYKGMHFVLAPILRLLFRIKVEGLENIPAGEGVVFCANHSAAIDPLLFCVALPRSVPVAIMAKAEVMRLPVIGAFFRALGAFSVLRGSSDMQAIRYAIKTVKEGANLLVFPEGTRVKIPGRVRAKGGIVMIAMRTGAQLLPVYIGGKKRVFGGVRVAFGAPYHAETASRRATAEEYQRFADDALKRIYALGGVDIT